MLEKLELPHSKKFPLPGVINCPGGCKEVYYCRWVVEADGGGGGWWRLMVVGVRFARTV
ncbi:putative histone-lysine N-methyltransferase [Helianthus annuus]|uniref:Histone-lysine N-methyltransferase n=1 Tax=Helianthus annuus TaxID=4232 RepID=A0A251VE28_HELAN|nr:putative histone-lysine N-methyltransferase [Helianthus annuus]KAJ0776586.1 putative [histone H3]-lysine(4) N-trimethyltransferase [Helianthus annuus]